MAAVQLIVGLGNPGAEYEGTRHNAGFWFADAVARGAGAAFRRESKFHGELCKATVAGNPVWLLKPMTYMNRSGLSVATLSRFYKIPPEQILVAHDELDLPPGTAKFKQGGGHGGHNGLRDTIAHLSSNQFQRLRLGIGHPGSSHMVTNFVLGRFGKQERSLFDQVIDEACLALPDLINGQTAKAMTKLHAFKA